MTLCLVAWLSSAKWNISLKLWRKCCFELSESYYIFFTARGGRGNLYMYVCKTYLTPVEKKPVIIYKIYFIYNTNQGIFFFFFSIWIFFHEHSIFTGQQGKGEGVFLTPLYHFQSLHRHLGISRAITADSSPLYIACSRTRTGNLWFPSASC